MTCPVVTPVVYADAFNLILSTPAGIINLPSPNVEVNALLVEVSIALVLKVVIAE